MHELVVCACIPQSKPMAVTNGYVLQPTLSWHESYLLLVHDFQEQWQDCQENIQHKACKQNEF